MSNEELLNQNKWFPRDEKVRAEIARRMAHKSNAEVMLEYGRAAEAEDGGVSVCPECGQQADEDEDGLHYCPRCDLQLDHLTEGCDECAEQREYNVVWSYETYADSPQDAARLAHYVAIENPALDPDRVWTVTDVASGESFDIELPASGDVEAPAPVIPEYGARCAQCGGRIDGPGYQLTAERDDGDGYGDTVGPLCMACLVGSMAEANSARTSAGKEPLAAIIEDAPDDGWTDPTRHSADCLCEVCLPYRKRQGWDCLYCGETFDELDVRYDVEQDGVMYKVHAACWEEGARMSGDTSKVIAPPKSADEWDGEVRLASGAWMERRFDSRAEAEAWARKIMAERDDAESYKVTPNEN